MIGTESTAEVKANVEVRPPRSQVFLVASAVVAIVSLVCGAGLLALDKAAGWAFLGFAVFALGGAFWAWKNSQSDVDLHNAHPTQIALPDGTNISTDSRTLRSPDGVRGMVEVFAEILCRQPLPEPDGMVDAGGKIIPDSRGKAVAIANHVNAEIQGATNNLLDAFGLSHKDHLVTQAADHSGIKRPEVTAAQTVNIAGQS